MSFGPVTLICQDSNSTAINLTGFGVASLARPQLESPNNIDLQPVISDPTNGVIEFAEFTDAETSAMALGEYGYDLVLINLSSERIGPFIAGPFTVLDYYSRA